MNRESRRSHDHEPANAATPSLSRTLIAALALAWHAHRSALAGRLALTVLAGLMPVAAAWLVRLILNLLIASHPGGHPGSRLLTAGVMLAAVGGLQAVLPSLGQYLSAQSDRASQRLTTAGLFAAVNRLTSLRKLEDPAFHDRLNMAQHSGSSGPGQLLSSGVAVAQAALTLAGFVATLAVLSPVIAGIVLLAAVPGIYSEFSLSRQQVAVLAGFSHAQRRQLFYANLLTDYAAAKEIRLFGLGEFFKGRLLAELRDIQRANERVDRRALAMHTALAGLGAAIAVGGLLWSIFAAARGQLTVGDVSIFIVALGSVSSSLAMIIANAALAHQALLMFRCYLQVVAEGPDLAQRSAPVPPLRSGIELADVWFRYGPDQPWVLRGVSLFIPHGQAVALVGHNGAGKSTLVKLICRFYEPDRGAILWDGVDIRDMSIAGLRNRISVVFQDFMTYDLSAAENIAVGDLGQAADRRALASAAEQAGIHDALTALPDGYDTLLTRTYFDLADRDDPRTGVLLSGGQWQRIGIARALLRASRDLLILDEPSSGLDAEAEHQLHNSLRASRGHRATLLISHRLNTIRDAEHIVVLADGVIKEQGRHAELMARKDVYARLFSLQAEGYAGEPASARQGDA